MNKLSRIFKWLGIVVSAPVALFLFLAILLYIPFVQRFAVNIVTDSLSESLEMDIRIKQVNLAFPLDLALHDVTAIEQGDTLLCARSLRLNVAMLPLLKGRADVDGFSLYGLKINTKSYISDTRIEGTAGELTASSHGIDWVKEKIRLDRVSLRKADISVALSDTGKVDMVSTPSKWDITVMKADVEHSRVRLTMPGDSMCIGTQIGTLTLRDGRFDTGRSFYAVRSLKLRGTSVCYDLPRMQPVSGFDPSHIALSDVALQLDTLTYDSLGVLRAGLSRLALHEKCGLVVKKLSGNIYMDSKGLILPKLELVTPYSQVNARIAFDFNAFESGKGGHLDALINAQIGHEDVQTMAQGYVDKQTLSALPRKPFSVNVAAKGNMNHMSLPEFKIVMPGVATLKAGGYASDLMMAAARKGKLNIELDTRNLTPVRQLIPAGLRQTITVPDGVSARGIIGLKGNVYDADLRVQSGSGQLKTQVLVNMQPEYYQVNAQAVNFPLSTFLIDQPLTPFSGRLKATGRGFDVLSARSLLQADAQIQALKYDKYNLQGLNAQADLRNGKGKLHFASDNSMLKADGQLETLLGTKGYDIALAAEIEAVDLNELGVTKDSLKVGTFIDLKAHTNKAFTAYNVNGTLRSNHFTTPKMSTMAKDIHFDFATSKDTTSAMVSAGDLRLRLGSKGDVPLLADKLGILSDEFTRQLDRREIDQEMLKRMFPVMALYIDAGRDNPVYNILRMKGYSFSSAYLNLNTDPMLGMTGDMRIGALKAGGLLLDTIHTNILQDTTGVQLRGLVKNGKKNPTPLEVRLKGYMLKAGAGLELVYLDSDGEKGVDVGLQAELTEGGAYVHLYPERPILAYRKFKVNKGNFIYLGKDKSIRADMDMLADDGTGIKIYGQPNDSLNDITLSVNRLNLAELSSVLPYMPKLGGMFSGDVHVTAAPDYSNMSAVASIKADGFKYEGTSLGNIGVEALYLPQTEGRHFASAYVSSNEEEVLAVNGTYFEKGEGSFEGDANLHDFPLQLLNGFMVGTDVALKGKAAGDLVVKGTFDKPVVNGSLDLDSAHIYSDVYGFDFRTDERAVKIDDSRLLFDQYNLYSTGKEPLVLDGVFDMSDFSKMKMDFVMKARNFELINTRKKAKSMVFGKVYSNFIGSLKGTTDNLSIRGRLEVLDRTDMTYVLKDSPLSVDDRLNDLVQFVNFKDTTSRTQVDPVPEGGFDLTLAISVSDAARFHCNLSDDGQSYVNLEGGGDMTLRMTQQGDMRMTGRFTANSGEMKYALPVIPLKTFNLVQGSYVEFTGDVMNPILNIAAKERTKVVVTENGKPRSVAFDVGVAITKPLSEMGLEFTIEAPEDLAIQNQLAAMSTEQRGKAAVTMMATGMYMTDETMLSGSGFKANNALNAFLQSEIQNIAGSALKTIDINLGVESGTAATGTSTTDYSFQFAKRFWGNRISVIIGGKVSTGADAVNSAESFINNVSVEYRLDQSATRYIKVFYNRDNQDPLEGQLTKTGAGLILRRKTDRLGELFIFKKKKKDDVTR